jgi:hypothetical protein
LTLRTHFYEGEAGISRLFWADTKDEVEHALWYWVVRDLKTVGRRVFFRAMPEVMKQYEFNEDKDVWKGRYRIGYLQEPEEGEVLLLLPGVSP